MAVLEINFVHAILQQKYRNFKQCPPAPSYRGLFENWKEMEIYTRKYECNAA